MSSVPPPPVNAPVPKLKSEDQPADLHVPDNYVEHTLRTQKARPDITWSNVLQELNYLSLSIVTITPALAIYGAFTTELNRKTAIWSVIYYFITGLGT